MSFHYKNNKKCTKLEKEFPTFYLNNELYI